MNTGDIKICGISYAPKSMCEIYFSRDGRKETENEIMGQRYIFHMLFGHFCENISRGTVEYLAFSR